MPLALVSSVSTSIRPGGRGAAAVAPGEGRRSVAAGVTSVGAVNTAGVRALGRSFTRSVLAVRARLTPGAALLTGRGDPLLTGTLVTL